MKNIRAFTLIEVLIAIVILSIGTVSLMRMMSMGIFADVQVEKRMTALYLAQEKMEQIKNASTFNGINALEVARTALIGDFADYEREVIVAGNPKQVNVIVYWNAKGQDQSLELVSLFTDFGY